MSKSVVGRILCRVFRTVESVRSYNKQCHRRPYNIQCHRRPYNIQCHRCYSSESSRTAAATSKQEKTGTAEEVEQIYKNIMKKVPQPVVVVTTADYDILKNRWLKRGMTCTSFTNVSYQPPIVSICINNPSHMHDLLLKTQHFAVHVLSENQVRYGMNFAKHIEPEECQFGQIPHRQGHEGVPLIKGCAAVMQCRAHSVHTVGDHHVWYGGILDAEICTTDEKALLYYTKSFRSVGDEIFIQAFENATLPFEDWTHEAHLRMAWNYITEYGKDGAVPHIRLGIKKFNEQNKDKVKFGYHETITMFYIAEVAHAINQSLRLSTFEEFLNHNQYLLDRTIIAQYYTPALLYSDDARHKFIQPDLQPLPS